MRILLVLVTTILAATAVAGERTVTVTNGDWELIGDFVLPDATKPVPAVLMLNKAFDNRHVYRELAAELTRRGIASLRLDMRGHGDSTNLGVFLGNDATEADREKYIWNSETDVIAALKYLREHDGIDPDRLAVVGASYSGEEMAEAARMDGYASAYVALSPGSFSSESIAAMDESGVPWLFIVSRHERHLTEIAAEVQATTRTVEVIYLPGGAHATRILQSRPDMAERIAIWLKLQLNR